MDEHIWQIIGAVVAALTGGIGAGGWLMKFWLERNKERRTDDEHVRASYRELIKDQRGAVESEMKINEMLQVRMLAVETALSNVQGKLAEAAAEVIRLKAEVVRLKAELAAKEPGLP